MFHYYMQTLYPSYDSSLSIYRTASVATSGAERGGGRGKKLLPSADVDVCSSCVDVCDFEDLSSTGAGHSK